MLSIERTILSPFTKEYRALGTVTGVLKFFGSPLTGPNNEYKARKSVVPSELPIFGVILSYLQDMGLVMNVVHRNLKPANILVDAVHNHGFYMEGIVVAQLADFGLAKPRLYAHLRNRVGSPIPATRSRGGVETAQSAISSDGNAHPMGMHRRWGSSNGSY